MCSIECTSHPVHCTYTQCIVHYYLVYIVHSSVHSIHCTMYNVNCILYMYTILKCSKLLSQ